MGPYFTIWFSVVDSEYTFVECNLTMYTRTLVMYGFYLSFVKSNIFYDFVFNVNNYINVEPGYRSRHSD